MGSLYSEYRTWLHGFRAGFKLFGLVIAGIALFIIQPLWALAAVAALCAGAAHLVGHNILRHDLPHLVANRARLAGLGASLIDTLWLNPLAFPRNPYHHLVKHYQDGRLQVGHVNDPEQDARLALQAGADPNQDFDLQQAITAAGLLPVDNVYLRDAKGQMQSTTHLSKFVIRFMLDADNPAKPMLGSEHQRAIAGPFQMQHHGQTYHVYFGLNVENSYLFLFIQILDHPIQILGIAMLVSTPLCLLLAWRLTVLLYVGMGVGCGLVYLRTGRYWAAVAAHAVCNACAVGLMLATAT